MSRGPLMMVPGHEIGAAAWGSPAPHDAVGAQLSGVARTAPGHARCTCGEVSAESLSSGAARLRWLKRHREEIAGVPWSDRAQQEKTLRNWPETFAERGIGGNLTVWEESAPGCWTGVEGISGAVNLAVTDDASGLCVAARMPAGFEVTPHRWLAMAEALAEMLRQAGYRVTCAVPDCEYGRWSCPKRIAWAITVNPVLGAWNGTDDAARHRPVSDGRIEAGRG